MCITPILLIATPSVHLVERHSERRISPFCNRAPDLPHMVAAVKTVQIVNRCLNGCCRSTCFHSVKGLRYYSGLVFVAYRHGLN